MLGENNVIWLLKKQKERLHFASGFTLIELLAVLVVLVIIMLIAIPILLRVIEDIKLRALEDSCYGVIDSAKIHYLETFMQSGDSISMHGDVTQLTLSGEKPIMGTWTVETTGDFSNQIIIEDVVFESMSNYICTNKNDLHKVECTKRKQNDQYDAISLYYTYPEYTECNEVDCALNELYKVLLGE